MYLNTYINRYHYVHILGFVSVRILIILVVVWLIIVIIPIANEFLEEKKVSIL